MGVMTGQYLPTPQTPFALLVAAGGPDALPLPGPIAERANARDKRFANDLASINSDFTNAASAVPGLPWAFRRYQNIRLTSVIPAPSPLGDEKKRDRGAQGGR